MGRCALGYVFKNVSRNNIEVVIAEIPGVKIQKNGKYNNYGSHVNWFMDIDYKGNHIPLSFFFREKTNEYVRTLPTYNDGFDETRKFIPEFGEEKSVLIISTSFDGVNIDVMHKILKEFGGVLIPDDCGDKVFYVMGSKENKVIYKCLRNVPDAVLKYFIKDYMTNKDITKINNRLQIKIRGMDLFKEFVIRNIDK